MAESAAERLARYTRLGTLSLAALPPLSLYVHLPWCLKKCPYCDFNSHEWQGGGRDGHSPPEQRYLDALRADLEASLPFVWGRRVISVFIGGGTPSLFSPDAIATLIGDIRARWEALLKIERVATPLGRPELLVYLIDETLDEIFRALRGTGGTSQAREAFVPPERARCECGRNPFLAYFVAGEQAVLDELIHAQSEAADADRAGNITAAAELSALVRQLAQREVETFCSLCTHATASAKLPAPLAEGG